MTINKNFEDIREARKMYDGGRAAKRGWNCGDCGAEKNRSDQCRSCGSPKRYHLDHPSNAHLKEDLASGRPAKKPVSSNLLKQRAKDNEKALKSGFMKMPDYARKKFDEMVSGFKKDGEGVSKAGNLHTTKQQDADSSKVADALDKHEFKKKRLETIRKVHKKVIKKKGIKEATSKEVLAKRMKSDHPDDNPQAFRQTKSPIKDGPKTYKMHGKFQDSGRVSQKGKTAALKKQHKRRPKDYGITESAPAEGDVDKKTMGQINRRIDKEMKKKGIKTNWMKGIKEDKKWPRPYTKAERDEFLAKKKKANKEIADKNLKQAKGYNPASLSTRLRSEEEKAPTGKHKVSSDTKKTIDQISKDKEDRKKAINKSTRRGRLPEAKKPVVHFKGEDKLKTVKIKYNKPIKTKVTDIGPGGKEVVRKDWSEEQKRIVESLSKLIDRGIEDKRKERTTQVGQKRAKDGKSLEPVMGKTKAPKHLLVRYGKPEKKR